MLRERITCIILFGLIPIVRLRLTKFSKCSMRDKRSGLLIAMGFHQLIVRNPRVQCVQNVGECCLVGGQANDVREIEWPRSMTQIPSQINNEPLLQRSLFMIISATSSLTQLCHPHINLEISFAFSKIRQIQLDSPHF